MPKLAINQPGDQFEQEADRVADQVMRMTDADVLQRKCATCEEEDEKKLHRKESSSAASANAVAPPIVHDVIKSPGRPLDAATRAFFEPRFGRDLSEVRIHADSKAAASTKAINASAYAIGNHIALGDIDQGAASWSSRWLMAHELTHVMQQSRSSHGPQTVQRRGPLLVPPPVRTQPLVTPTIGNQLAPDRFDDSFEAMLERANIRDYAERERIRNEAPIATLASGGTAPSFITEKGTRQHSWLGGPGGGGTVTVRIREFHVLDAIDHRVAAARNLDELLQVLYDLVPQSAVEFAEFRRSRIGILPSYWRPIWDMPIFPQHLDPTGEVRFERFTRALRLRGVDTFPDLRRQPLPAALADILLSTKVERREGPCNVQPVPRRGGHAQHNAYAANVTGSPDDFEITTPEGLTCITDGLDPQNRTWEVKSLHKYITDLGLVQQGFRSEAAFHQIASRFEEQRARCTYVTARCGYRYIWGVQYREVEEHLNDIWDGLPPVFCRTQSGAPC